jgi:hypothetical protein
VVTVDGTVLSEVMDAIVVVVVVGVEVEEVLVVVLGAVVVVVVVVLVVLVVLVVEAHVACGRVCTGIARSGSRLPWHEQSCFGDRSAQVSI